MDTNLLIKLVNDGKSISEISNILNTSRTNTRYWLKKLNLKTDWANLLKNKIKITDEQLIKTWEESISINSFLKKLGLNTSGGSWYHYKKRLSKLGVCVKKDPLIGKRMGGLTTAAMLNQQALHKKERLRRNTLLKLMNMNNIEYKCVGCEIKKWKDKEIKLHIHHKNDDRTDNRLENLEYLCPNCHTQKHYKN